MSSRFWDDDTGLPVSRKLTPLEEALARAQPFHQHEWKGHTFRLWHSHQHGGEHHQHPVDELVDQVKAGEADPETYGVRVVCLQCGHDCHVAPLPGRGGHRAGQELPDDDSPRSAWVVHCPAADDCTECPMSRCRFDDARWWRAGRKAAFEALFARLLTAGYTAESIAEHTGFSEWTVYRANRRHHNKMDYSDEDLAAFARIHDVPSVEALGPHLRLRPAPVRPKGRQCVDCKISIEGRRGPAVRCEPCGVVYARQWRRDYAHRKKQEAAPVAYPVRYSSSGVPLGSLPHRHETGEDYCTAPACRPALEVAA